MFLDPRHVWRRSLPHRKVATRSIFRLGNCPCLGCKRVPCGLGGGDFLLLLRHQNRWVKRLSAAGILLAWWFVFATGTSPSCDPGSVHVDSCMGQLGFRIEGECMASLGHCRLLGLGMGSDGAKSTRNATQLCCHGRVDWLEESAMVERACRCTMGHDSLVAGSVWRDSRAVLAGQCGHGTLADGIRCWQDLAWYGSRAFIHSWRHSVGWTHAWKSCGGNGLTNEWVFGCFRGTNDTSCLCCGACWESNGCLKGFADGWW